MVDLAHLTLADAARMIAARELSSLDLVEATFARIAAFDARLDSHVTLMPESALAAARAADAEIAAGRRRGPLHGVTVALKDIYDTEGVLTAGGSKTALARVPGRDAETVRRLRAAGAVITGKLTTHEFAHGGPSFDLPWPPARNPWNAEHFSGGSSSGSAVAVAAGFCLGALGTDTGGSIRGPAALSGTTGLMPSYGLVSRRGVIPNSFTFDHCGPLAWTAEDCGLLLDVLAGFDPQDPRSSAEPQRPPPASIAGLRVGLLRHFWEEDLAVAPETVTACEHVADVIASLGAKVETARIAPVQDWYDVKITIAESELFNVHRRKLQTCPRDFGQDFLSRAVQCPPAQASDLPARFRSGFPLPRARSGLLHGAGLCGRAPAMAPAAAVNGAGLRAFRPADRAFGDRAGAAPRCSRHGEFLALSQYHHAVRRDRRTGAHADRGFLRERPAIGRAARRRALPGSAGAGGRTGIPGRDRMGQPPPGARS